MNLEQIRNQYSMADVIRKCGLKIERGGFCVCPFHSKDNTPSLKIYNKSYYCFGCGKGGDVISFVMDYNGLDFIEACEWISGEELTRSTKRHIAVARIKQKKERRDSTRLDRELDKVNRELTGLWKQYQQAAPLTDEWTRLYNKWQLLCYKQETIYNEMREQ